MGSGSQLLRDFVCVDARVESQECGQFGQAVDLLSFDPAVIHPRNETGPESRSSGTTDSSPVSTAVSVSSRPVRDGRATVSTGSGPADLGLRKCRA